MKLVQLKQRQWNMDEMLYIIYKNGGVWLIGSEAKFVDHYFSKLNETHSLEFTREELIKNLITVNRYMLDEIESYYAKGMTIIDVMQIEADKHNTTIEELFFTLMEECTAKEKK